MIRVDSETGRLRAVLLHEPGLEIDHMVPSMMEDLLFDDILFGERAREEYGLFRRVLQFLDVEMLETQSLLEEVLAEEACRRWVLTAVLEDVSRPLRDRLDALEPKALAEALVSGVRAPEARSGVEVEDLFDLAPLPNFCFQRDPQAVVGGSVILGAMMAPARYREAILARALFRFHPRLRQAEVLYDPLERQPGASGLVGPHRPTVEGGDLLVASSDVLVVGRSERTNRTGILQLASALARRPEGPRWLVAVVIPRRRAYMHLDTLLTPVDQDACLLYAPVIQDGGREAAEVYTVDLHASERSFNPSPPLLQTLASLGIHWEPIRCGGPDPVTQQREQWTDGANALALAPGVILLYDRNVGTLEELQRHGFSVVHAEDLVLGREDLDLAAERRACIVLPSNEICRARGGPHCLTHPLQRDPLP